MDFNDTMQCWEELIKSLGLNASRQNYESYISRRGT